MKTFLKLFLITVALFSFSNNVLSQQRVPATPYPIKYIQPNGNEIVYRLHGDERMSYKTTLNGYLIQKAENNFFYYIMYNSKKNKYILKTKVSNKSVPRFAIKPNDNYLKSRNRIDYCEK